MKTILLASELGSGLGHLMRLHPIAACLARSGNRVVLASRRRQPADAVFSELHRSDLKIELIPSPPLEVRSAAPEEPSSSLADVLAHYGYSDAQSLFPAAARWNLLLGKVRPDLIIADFAPTLTLVARGRVPVISVGSGYSVPPPAPLLPLIRPWDREMPASSIANEQRVLEACAQLARANGLAPVTRLTDLFRGDTAFPCTFSVLDPYRRLRRERLWLPMNLKRPQTVPSGHRSGERRAFVYLPAKHPFLAHLLHFLVGLRWQVAAYIEGSRSGLDLPAEVELRSERPDLAAVLGEADLVVHHAGLGTAHAAIVAGVRQLLFPLGLEHHVTAHILVGLGIARAFSASEPLQQEVLEEAVVTPDAGAATNLASKAAKALAAVPNSETTLARVLRVAANQLGTAVPDMNDPISLPAGALT